jgi:hypothetical protein
VVVAALASLVKDLMVQQMPWVTAAAVMILHIKVAVGPVVVERQLLEVTMVEHMVAEVLDMVVQVV